MSVSKEDVKRVMDEVDALDLPDGAHWMLVHERLGLEYGDVFEIISADPKFFGTTEVATGGEQPKEDGN